MTTTESNTYTLDDLSYFWTAEGLPAFDANRDDICDIVESIGFNIYYLLANSPKTLPANNTNNKHNNNNNKNNNKSHVPTPPPAPTVVNETTWFKVVNNFVGRTVSKVNPPLNEDYISLSESAHYNMPLIPFSIIDKLDQFFRLVDAQHGTESIVMLTYDLDKEGSEGWGILVPDQENTPAHCNYDPHSIAEMKPDNVMIVGSVHSHPHMAAYASGTDHADQADFDGIHITYGWQKSVNNGATQYHIELQMAGQAYTLKPEDVFEDYTIQKDPDPDVVEWSGKVKKELPPLMGVPQSQSHNPTYRPQPATKLGTLDPYITPSIYSSSKLQWHSEIKKIPYFKDLPEGSFIVLETSSSNPDKAAEYCMVCSSYIDSYCVYDGVCDVCMVPIVSKDTPRETIIENVAYYASQLHFSTDNPVFLIGQDSSKSFFAIKLCEKLSDHVKSKQATSSTSYTEMEDDYLLCCGIHIEDIKTCFCDPQILYEDYIDFDLDTRDIEVYDKDLSSNCSSCDHYNNYSCPKIDSQLLSYVKSKPKYLSRVSLNPPMIHSDGCNSYIPYDVTQKDYEGSLYYEQ